MSRCSPTAAPPPTEGDPVLWFARLVRAVEEKDWPMAVLMRDTLASLGWDVRDRAPRRKALQGQGGGR